MKRLSNSGSGPMGPSQQAVNGINLIDRWDEMRGMLFPKTARAIEQKKYNTLIELKDDGTGTAIRFLAVRTNDLYHGLGTLANVIEDVSKKYQICGHLAACTELALTDGTYILVSYLAYDLKDCELIDAEIKSGKDTYFISEGGQPRT